MIRVRVAEETFDYLTRAAGEREMSLAAFVRDVLEAFTKPVSASSDTVQPEPVPEPLPPQRSGVGRPTVDQWERMNKWMRATGRSPEPGEVKTRSGLLAWAVSQGFQP